MKLLSWGLVLSAFLIGWIMSGLGTSGRVEQLVELPSISDALSTSPRPSPANRINESQILVYSDKVVIQAGNIEWASFTDTHSMEPVLDKNSNALEIVPRSLEEIKLGDIISYQPEGEEYPIIHRVIKIGNDSQGWYAIVKGDNNPVEDPAKVRFSQIKRIVVAIIY